MKLNNLIHKFVCLMGGGGGNKSVPIGSAHHVASASQNLSVDLKCADCLGNHLRADTGKFDLERRRSHERGRRDSGRHLFVFFAFN